MAQISSKSGTWTVLSALSRSVPGSSSSLPHRSGPPHGYAEQNGGLIVNSRLLETESRFAGDSPELASSTPRRQRHSLRAKKGPNGEQHQANGSAVSIARHPALPLPPPDVLNDDSDSTSHSSRMGKWPPLPHYCVIVLASSDGLSSRGPAAFLTAS